MTMRPKISLFVMNSDDVEVRLSADTIHSFKKPRHLIRLWTENDLVYITAETT